MERFVQALFERLDKAGQGQLICIMDNAINEMHNNGIISRVSPEIAAKLHDPDPNVRVTEKTSLAKSVGYSFVVSSKPGVTENGICHTVEINNDARFPNSIAICIQGGLEGLYQTGIFKKTNSGIMDYNVVIRKNSQDSSGLENNLSILNDLYKDFNIRVMFEMPDASDNQKAQSPEKKKGLIARLFGK